MAFDISDPLNIAPSSTFGSEEIMDLEDLLGSSQVPTDAHDEPMSDFHGESGIELGTSKAQSTAEFIVEDTEAEFPWVQMLQGDITDLDDTDSEMERDDDPEEITGDDKSVNAKDGDQIKRTGDEKSVNAEDGDQINTESSERVGKCVKSSRHTISLSEEEDDDDEPTAAVNIENSKEQFNWANMDERTIDMEDQTPSMVPIKEEPKDATFVWADMGKGAIDLSDSDEEPNKATGPKLGKSILRNPSGRGKPTPEVLEKMIQRQKLYAERALGKRVVAGAGGIFKTPQITKTNVTDSFEPTLDANGFEWMESAVIPDDDTEIDFQKIKKAYKEKKKARKTTWEDDVAFKKAQDIETSRINRLAQEAEDSDEDESEECEDSEDGLFMSQAKPSTKRPFEANIDDDPDDASEKRPRTALPGKRARRNFFEKELRCNRLAGIEPILQKDREKLEREKLDKDAADIEGADATQHKSKPTKDKKGQRATPKSKFAKKKSTETGCASVVNSLFNSNVYKDANANLGVPTLPVISEKRKKDAVTSILASASSVGKKKNTSDMNDILKATKILGLRKVLPDGNGNWAFKGMRTSLFHYQVQGAARMKERELGPSQPLGGLLCDEMGLGKTVMTIATMIANRPPKEDNYRCTLIVCSPALLTQWEEELEKHVDPSVFTRVIRYHSGNRVIGKGAVLDLERADVVLTTYQEVGAEGCGEEFPRAHELIILQVVRSYPKCAIPKDIETIAEKEGWWNQLWEKRRDLLHRAQFYRIVLDGYTEAQAIKNHKSLTSIACRALMAKLRWGCSATPVQNRLEELFSYFKFLRVNHTGSFSVFQHNFCLKGNDDCNIRLHARLDQMMIRRTHKDMLLGAPLVSLPKNNVDTIRLSFNEVERTVYELVRNRCVKAINAFARSERIEENRPMIMILFQRLRQMTAHIFMVQEVLEKAYESTDLDEIWRQTVPQTTEVDNPEQNMMLALKKMIAIKEDPEKTGPAATMNFGPPPDINGAVGKKPVSISAKFGRFLRDLRKNALWSDLRDRTLCNKCGVSPEDPMVTSCCHVYCRECLTNLAYEASKNDQDQTTCHKCKKIYSACESCNGLKELNVEDLASKISEERTRKKPFKLSMDYVDDDDKILLSTKTSAVVAQLDKWVNDDPKRKIIVFSDWHLVFHVLTRVCQQKGWKCCNYNGKMSHRARDLTLKKFREDAEIKIMIASLKCGGQGLNLTVASRVICVDLWFNSCVEQQAFCRVFRIGQTEETFITRFMVEDTVDAKLIKMQEEKREIISAAMDDRDVLSKLSMEQLMRLFGEVAYDSNSRPFILVDDEEDAGRKEKLAPK